MGYEDFREVLDSKLYFVDKSMFIKDILCDKSDKAIIITRPRRFGKTLNLSMLHHFLASQINGKPTASLFDELKIAKCGQRLMQEQGSYPVIFITLKGIDCETYARCFSKFKELMAGVFRQHRYLLNSTSLDDDDKHFFRTIMKAKGTGAQYDLSIKRLSEFLYNHHQVKPWLLVDEYDTPLHTAYMHGFYKLMLRVISGCFSEALKTNSFVNRSVLVGITKIAKASLFSGMNNVPVFSVVDDNKYSEYFGFTEADVIGILQEVGMPERLADVRKWYNGYQIGKSLVYNPWSITNFIDRDGKVGPYWLNTAEDLLLRKLLLLSEREFRNQLEIIVAGKHISTTVDDEVAFGNLLTKQKTARFGLLLACGYLTARNCIVSGKRITCDLSIPNNEVRFAYREIIHTWLACGLEVPWFEGFVECLLKGRVRPFKVKLHRLMNRFVSYYDTAGKPEAFYHGMMIGLTAYLHGNMNYILRSNKESGKRRYDLMIFSKDIQRPTILFELKRVYNVSKQSDKIVQELRNEANNALEQVHRNEYLTEAEDLAGGQLNVIIIGLAYCGKDFELQHERVVSTGLKVYSYLHACLNALESCKLEYF